MPKYRITLASPDNDQKRYVTLSRVPCSSCKGDVRDRHTCQKCDGLGDEPATKDSAAAYVEQVEKDRVAFRLDDPDTLRRYPLLPENALELVQETTLWVPEDTHTVSNRFLRAGKVIVNPARDPSVGYSNRHKGWMSFHQQESPYKVMEVGSTSIKNAVTGFVYGVPIKNQYDGTAVVDWDTDTIKTSLHTAYTVDIDTHDFFNDVSASEVPATGNYVAGGMTLGTKTVTYDTATDQARLDSADPSIASSTISATDSVTYKSTGTASTSPLICSLDFGATVTTSAGTFSITVDSTGWFLIDGT